MTSYNTGNQFVGLSGEIALASEKNFGKTDQIRFLASESNMVIIDIVCRINGYQHGWCELGHDDDIISYNIINDTNTQWIVEYIPNNTNTINNSNNSNSSGCNKLDIELQNCDYIHPFRLITRMTGKMLSVSNINNSV